MKITAPFLTTVQGQNKGTPRLPIHIALTHEITDLKVIQVFR